MSSTDQLNQQITLDPVVRRRLARHFHTSAPAVTRYIQDNLVLKSITAVHRYRVYCVGRNGQEYTIDQRLAAGTPVFVLRTTGQPVLKLACGNPMVADLPQIAPKVAARKAPEITSSARHGTKAPAASSLIKAGGPVLVAMNDVPGVIVMPTTRVAGFIGQLPAVHSSGVPLGYLAGIPLLATIIGRGGDHNTASTGPTQSSDTSGTTGTTGTTGTNTLGTTTSSTGASGTAGSTTTGTDTGSTGVTPVPEPSTPVAFGVGGIMLLLVLGRAKRNGRPQVH